MVVAVAEMRRAVTFSKGLGSVGMDILNLRQITILRLPSFFQRLSGFALRILEVIINIMRNLDTVSPYRGPVQHLFGSPVHLKVLGRMHRTKRKRIEQIQQLDIVIFCFLLLSILELETLSLCHILIGGSMQF